MAGAGGSRQAGGMRRRSAWQPRRGRALLVSLLIVAVGPSCRKEETAAPADAGGPREVRRYSVRGEVVRLSDPAGRPGEILVRHERIDDFADSSGRVVGMPSMVMPFRVQSVRSAEGLSVGDKIEIRFKVDWSGPALDVEDVKKLQATTQLHFEAATSAAEGGQTRR